MLQMNSVLAGKLDEFSGFWRISVCNFCTVLCIWQVIQWGTKAVLHSSWIQSSNISQCQPPAASPHFWDLATFEEFWADDTTLVLLCHRGMTAGRNTVCHHGWQPTYTQFLSSSCLTNYFYPVPELIMRDNLLLISSWAHHVWQTTSNKFLSSACLTTYV